MTYSCNFAGPATERRGLPDLARRNIASCSYQSPGSLPRRAITSPPVPGAGLPAPARNREPGNAASALRPSSRAQRTGVREQLQHAKQCPYLIEIFDNRGNSPWRVFEPRNDLQDCFQPRHGQLPCDELGFQRFQLDCEILQFLVQLLMCEQRPADAADRVYDLPNCAVMFRSCLATPPKPSALIRVTLHHRQHHPEVRVAPHHPGIGLRRAGSGIVSIIGRPPDSVLKASASCAPIDAPAT